VIATILAQSDGPNSATIIVGSLFWLMLGAAIGGIIGTRNGRMGLGIILGALLGCLGWIIVALLPKKHPY
jgi:hypothetical protein